MHFFTVIILKSTNVFQLFRVVIMGKPEHCKKTKLHNHETRKNWKRLFFYKIVRRKTMLFENVYVIKCIGTALVARLGVFCR